MWADILSLLLCNIFTIHDYFGLCPRSKPKPQQPPWPPWYLPRHRPPLWPISPETWRSLKFSSVMTLRSGYCGVYMAMVGNWEMDMTMMSEDYGDLRISTHRAGIRGGYRRSWGWTRGSSCTGGGQLHCASPIFFIEISFLLRSAAEAIGLGLFVLLPTKLIWAFLFHKFSNFTPPPRLLSCDRIRPNAVTSWRQCSSLRRTRWRLLSTSWRRRTWRWAEMVMSWFLNVA